jgi:hypothetical protein
VCFELGRNFVLFRSEKLFISKHGPSRTRELKMTLLKPFFDQSQKSDGGLNFSHHYME